MCTGDALRSCACAYREKNLAGLNEGQQVGADGRAGGWRAGLKASGRAGAANDPVLGVIFVIVAMALLACLLSLGRYLALQGMDPLQVLFFRNAFCVFWMLPLLAWRGASLFQTTQPKLYGARVVLSFISMMAMFQAVALIPIGEVTAIGFLSPLFGTAVAIMVLGERVHFRRWAALGIGFMGAMIIIRPGFTEPGWGQLAALVSALAVGGIGPLVKQLTQKDDADRVVFITNAIMTPLALVPALFVWRWPSLELWPYLAAMGLCAVLGHMALVRGYAVAEASLVMTFKFVRLPFAVAIGFLAFGEAIDALTWVGGLIIFAASAYVTRRESQLKLRAPSRPAAGL